MRPGPLSSFGRAPPPLLRTAVEAGEHVPLGPHLAEPQAVLWGEPSVADEEVAPSRLHQAGSPASSWAILVGQKAVVVPKKPQRQVGPSPVPQAAAVCQPAYSSQAEDPLEAAAGASLQGVDLQS